MANRYCTIDELNEVSELIKDVLVSIRGSLETQQTEIKMIARQIASLREEVYELNREKASRDREDIG